MPKKTKKEKMKRQQTGRKTIIHSKGYDLEEPSSTSDRNSSYTFSFRTNTPNAQNILPTDIRTQMDPSLKGDLIKTVSLALIAVTILFVLSNILS